MLSRLGQTDTISSHRFFVDLLSRSKLQRQQLFLVYTTRAGKRQAYTGLPIRWKTNRKKSEIRKCKMPTGGGGGGYAEAQLVEGIVLQAGR